MLLQLCVEVLYFDMDTFAVTDFVTSVLEIADGVHGQRCEPGQTHDILFARH